MPWIWLSESVMV